MSYRIAALLVGLVVAAYWARVLKMARKARRATGRAANLLPPEPIGKLLRLLWTPIVLVWVVHPFITALRDPRVRWLAPLWRTPWVAWPAVTVVAACFWATRLCWRRMGKSWRMGIDPSERTPLVLDGPFAYVRHPIYAISQVMIVASAAVISSPLMIAAAVLHLLLLQWEARREEGYLLRVHGGQYADYCARVGRFVPSARMIGTVGEK